MCYLKNFAQEQSLYLDSLDFKDQQFFDRCLKSTDQLSPIEHKPLFFEQKKQQSLMNKLFDIIDKNNRLISKLNNSLCHNSQQVEKISINFENQNPIATQSLENAQKSFEASNKTETNSSSLCERLFGERNYKFHLQVTQKFENVIYKERNFNIQIRLVNKNGQIIRNSNMLNLCFALCTVDAEWIHENRVGDPIIKGKTETQIVKGQAIFQKLYARQVSRIYPEGKVNIVIYPKPLNIKYCMPGSYEQHVDSQEIEPLIIQNISIKAKRKD